MSPRRSWTLPARFGSDSEALVRRDQSSLDHALTGSQPPLQSPMAHVIRRAPGRLGRSGVRRARRTVTGAGRVEGETGVWQITVTPDTREGLSISLAPTADCEAGGAVCTEDGRALSTGEVRLVTGPGPETRIRESDRAHADESSSSGTSWPTVGCAHATRTAIAPAAAASARPGCTAVSGSRAGPR